jgi:hypothetical protein
MIKIDMDMPKSCSECMLIGYVSTDFVGNEVEIRCIPLRKTFKYPNTTFLQENRLPQCPLIEVKDNEKD